MLARASAPIERDKQAVLSCLYADDLREQLVAAGVPAGEIRDGSPRDASRGPGRLVPDGRRDRVELGGCRAIWAGRTIPLVPG
jgi:hypothetical protein